jgi:hypothetical protein
MDTISKGEMRKPDVEEWQNKPNDEFTGIDYADGVLNGRLFPPRTWPTECYKIFQRDNVKILNNCLNRPTNLKWQRQIIPSNNA